jgi:hypothetical protein
MKQIIKASAVIFSAIALASSAVIPAHGATGSLVIIDSYFDSRSGVTVACSPAATSCGIQSKPLSTSMTHSYNHGVAMAELAKSKYPSLNVIGLQSANASSTVNVAQLISSLEWVVANKSGVSAVSISLRMNSPQNSSTVCLPAATGTANIGGVAGADQKVRSLIAALSSSGVKVFAAAGNGKGNVVDYPACILETESVSTGLQNASGVTVSKDKFDNNTDYFVSIANGKSNFISKNFNLVANTSSTATVIAAAKWAAENSLTKFVSVLP